uniref:Uncharacterized protein n=1 Tax=Panagrellus redivivus TaxID=6233 RepID=A0A7E5A219_PANRE
MYSDPEADFNLGMLEAQCPRFSVYPRTKGDAVCKTMNVCILCPSPCYTQAASATDIIIKAIQGKPKATGQRQTAFHMQWASHRIAQGRRLPPIRFNPPTIIMQPREAFFQRLRFHVTYVDNY